VRFYKGKHKRRRGCEVGDRIFTEWNRFFQTNCKNIF